MAPKAMAQLDDHAAIMNAVETAGEGGTRVFSDRQHRVTKLSTPEGPVVQGPALNSDSRPESSGSHIFADHAGICINMGKDKSASIHSMRIPGEVVSEQKFRCYLLCFVKHYASRCRNLEFSACHILQGMVRCN